MEMKSIEVYSEASNHAVIRVPGRRFPGSLIQGDTLSSLFQDMRDVCKRVAQLGIEDEELLWGCQSIQKRLLERLLGYQDVLSAHGIEHPGPTVTASDQFNLIEANGDNAL